MITSPYDIKIKIRYHSHRAILLKPKTGCAKNLSIRSKKTRDNINPRPHSNTKLDTLKTNLKTSTFYKISHFLPPNLTDVDKIKLNNVTLYGFKVKSRLV